MLNVDAIIEDYNDLQFWKHQAEICRFELTIKEYERFDELEEFLLENIHLIQSVEV